MAALYLFIFVNFLHFAYGCHRAADTPTPPVITTTTPIVTYPTPTYTPTYPTETVPTVPTVPTIPTIPTIPTYTPTVPTVPTIPTIPTIPTYTPTVPTIPSQPTLTPPCAFENGGGCPQTPSINTQPPTVTYSTQPPTVTYSTKPPTVTYSTQPPTVTYSRRTYSTTDPPSSRSTYSADEKSLKEAPVTPAIAVAGLTNNISANLDQNVFHVQTQFDDVDDIELQTGPDNYDVKMLTPLENDVCLQSIDKNSMAPLIYNTHQPGITSVSASLPMEQCACSRNFNIHFHQSHNSNDADIKQNNAWRAWKDAMFFDLRTNSECQRLCVCTMAGKCFTPNESGAKMGAISVRFSADCSVSPCLMRAVVHGSGRSTDAAGGCLVERGGAAKKCAFNVGQSFDAVAVSCNGCPSQKVLKCAEFMAR